jgi:hypothetical protein
MKKDEKSSFFTSCNSLTSRQLPCFQVIGDTFVADSLARAWLKSAVALFKIFFLAAFHKNSLDII